MGSHLLFPECMLSMELVLGAKPIKISGVWLMLNHQQEAKKQLGSELGRHLNSCEGILCDWSAALNLFRKLL